MSLVGVVLLADAGVLLAVLGSLAGLQGHVAHSQHDPVPIDSI